MAGNNRCRVEAGVTAVYARTSHSNTDGEPDTSIEAQLELAQQVIQKDSALRCYTKREYVDEGYSGTGFNRPAVRKLLADIYLGEIQALVVKDFSRLSRNHLQLAEFMEKIQYCHPIRVIAVGEGFDSGKGDEFGLSGNIRGIFYEYYCLDTSRKVKTALKARKSAGHYAVGRPPFGYVKDQEGNWQIQEQQAKLVREIFALADRGHNTAQIAAILNQKPGMSGFWQASRVWRILNNPVYYGVQVWHKYENHYRNGFYSEAVPRENWKIQQGQHPAIISEETYLSVHSRRKSQSVHARKRRRRHIFHGLTRCGVCGQALCRHRRDAGWLICKNNSHPVVKISTERLWEICQWMIKEELAREESGRICSEEIEFSWVERELLLHTFMKRIWIFPGEIYLLSDFKMI